MCVFSIINPNSTPRPQGRATKLSHSTKCFDHSSMWSQITNGRRTSPQFSAPRPSASSCGLNSSSCACACSYLTKRRRSCKLRSGLDCWLGLAIPSRIYRRLGTLDHLVTTRLEKEAWDGDSRKLNRDVFSYRFDCIRLCYIVCSCRLIFCPYENLTCTETEKHRRRLNCPTSFIQDTISGQLALQIKSSMTTRHLSLSPNINLLGIACSFRAHLHFPPFPPCDR